MEGRGETKENTFRLLPRKGVLLVHAHQSDPVVVAQQAYHPIGTHGRGKCVTLGVARLGFGATVDEIACVSLVVCCVAACGVGRQYSMLPKWACFFSICIRARNHKRLYNLVLCETRAAAIARYQKDHPERQENATHL